MLRIKKVKTYDESLLGVASVQFDNCLIIHGIKLMQVKNKRFVCFPSKRVKKYDVTEDGYQEKYGYTDIVHPSNKQFRNYIETELFKIYDNEQGEQNNE